MRNGGGISSRPFWPDKIVSGGQTGVDRAALDVAIELGIPHGGWVPAGRRTEAGPLPLSYEMKETGTAVYSERTMRNVRDAEATLIITCGETIGGTALIVEWAVKLGRPYFVFNLADYHSPKTITDWLKNLQVSILNVAGPRESTIPGIYDLSVAALHRAFSSS